MSLFDADIWRERMDERWFESGVAIADKGDVDLVSIEDEAVTAHVTGSAGDLYVVELRAPAGEGSCTCPGFEKFGACKHQAAVVAAVNNLDATAFRELQSRINQIRDSLSLESRENLIGLIIDLAKKNPNVMQALKQEEEINSSHFALDSDTLNKIIKNIENKNAETSVGSKNLKDELESNILELEKLLADISPPPLGHNHPPDSVEEEYSEFVKQIRQSQIAVSSIKNELSMPTPDTITIAKAGQKLHIASNWLGKKVNLAADEASKTVGKAAAVALIGLSTVSLAKWEVIAQKIASAAQAVIAWVASTIA
ncbi:SWIM zinc finger family protein, partial [Caulobacter hibisci]|nr:SWIM zinc finger family protein [Caulobacter hibisci]